MRIEVDPQACQGHTLCTIAAPGLFALREADGRASVAAEAVPPDMLAMAREAAASCPERAIMIDE